MFDCIIVVMSDESKLSNELKPKPIDLNHNIDQPERENSYFIPN
jgi:hypothetical protein